MVWPRARAANPPLVSVAGGYTLRKFRPAETEQYIELAREAGFDHFSAEILAGYSATVIPGGFFVVEHDPSGELAASAMAQHASDEMHPEGGVLGWVMGRAAHSGKGLGLTVCAAVTGRLLAAGYREIYLKTDDSRLPALKTYLKLGWVPLLFTPDMESRWQRVCARLAWPFEPDRWPRHGKRSD